MKQPHNMKKGDSKSFTNLGELQKFSETYAFESLEFEFSFPDGYILKMTKL